MSLFESASLVVTPNGAKASKLYAIKPTSGAGDLSVTRATTATRVNSAGLIESVAVNVPRLDYTNGSCPSILVEPQRTNVLTYSEALTPNYSFNQCSITSNQISPDGTNNAKRITNGAIATDVYFEQSVGVALSNYTWSAFVKKGTDTLATIKPVHVGIGGDVSLMTFTFATETISTSGAITTSGFTKLTNGWYRIFCTVPITLAVISLRGRFGNSNTPNVYNEWFGVQLEQGSYATSYIPTSSAIVTRNADVISKTGISSLIGQTEGTIYFEYLNKNGLGTIPFRINGNDGKFIWIRGTGAMFFGNSSALLFNNYSTPTANQLYKIAFVYGQNDFRLYVNGGLISSITTGTFTGTFDDVQIPALPNEDPFGQQVFIKSTALWKSKLSNSELATLTTI
jgi:hypothetical protein